jgi:hypothetical protein
MSKKYTREEWLEEIRHSPENESLQKERREWTLKIYTSLVAGSHGGAGLQQTYDSAFLMAYQLQKTIAEDSQD